MKSVWGHLVHGICKIKSSVFLQKNNKNLGVFKEIQRGNMLWGPSYCNVWRCVILPQDFFVAKPAK